MIKLNVLAILGQVMLKVLFPIVEEILNVELYILNEYKLNFASLNETGWGNL